MGVGLADAGTRDRERIKVAVRKQSRHSRSGRPIVALLEILGQRWALRVLWELRHEPVTFRELRAYCDDVSPTVLNNRLKTLRQHGLVDLSNAGYVSTPLGRELGERVLDLDRFAKRWARQTGGLD